MALHLQRQVNQLKKLILAIGARVEEAVQNSIRAVHDRDPDLAQTVIDNDQQIDISEVELEEECLHTLALYQPVAFDLRYVIATLKINNDLERIADLAVNIAEQAIRISGEAQMQELPFDLRDMGQRVLRMLRHSLDALVNIDPELADHVRGDDDSVDAIHREMYLNVEHAIRTNPAAAEQQIHMLGVSRNLERIADHAVNIAEDVIYMARGDILRHKRPHPLSDTPQETR